jgi:predicted amidophosphoribosyltransferase
VYDARARRVVSAWKERGRRDLAAPLAAVVTDVIVRPDAEVMTFVPGDKERGRERGHVPCARLAHALGERWELPVERLLVRTRPTARQASLPRSERRGNVWGAFGPSGVVPARVALVDDVYTTGATASACATALKRGGARRVVVVCLARAVR